MASHAPISREDHDVIEQMIVPAMLTIMASIMQKHIVIDVEAFNEISRTSALLKHVIRKNMAQYPRDHAALILFNVEHVVEDALSPLFDRHSIGILYQIVSEFIVGLARDDIISTGEHSPFSDAWELISEVWDVMAEIISRAVGRYPEIVDIAIAEAEVLRLNLSNMGYFVCSEAHPHRPA